MICRAVTGTHCTCQGYFLSGFEKQRGDSLWSLGALTGWPNHICKMLNKVYTQYILTHHRWEITCQLHFHFFKVRSYTVQRLWVAQTNCNGNSFMLMKHKIRHTTIESKRLTIRNHRNRAQVISETNANPYKVSTKHKLQIWSYQTLHAPVKSEPVSSIIRQDYSSLGQSSLKMAELHSPQTSVCQWLNSAQWDHRAKAPYSPTPQPHFSSNVLRGKGPAFQKHQKSIKSGFFSKCLLLKPDGRKYLDPSHIWSHFTIRESDATLQHDRKPVLLYTNNHSQSAVSCLTQVKENILSQLPLL